MTFKKYVKFAALMLPLTPFTREIGAFFVAGINIDMISYPFYLLSFIVFLGLHKLTFSKKEFILFGIFLVIGIINALLFDLPLKLFFKQYILILIFYLVAKTIMKYVSPVQIFEKYIKYAIIAAWFGIIQTLLKLGGIHILSVYQGLDSVALEPSHYVIMMLPAFIYFVEKKTYNRNFFLLLTTLILTFKLTFILALGMYFLIRHIKNIKIFVFVAPFVFLFSIYAINTSIQYQNRIDSALDFAHDRDMSKIENLTTFSFVSNLEVAQKNFIRTFGIGIGMGGHETSYLRIFKNVDIYSERWRGTNMKSAHSLLIRIISELGIVGIIILFMLFFNTHRMKTMEYKIIAWASLSHFVAKFFKSGSYFDYGTMFFLVMIVMMIQLDKQKRKIKR